MTHQRIRRGYQAARPTRIARRSKADSANSTGRGAVMDVQSAHALT